MNPNAAGEAAISNPGSTQQGIQAQGADRAGLVKKFFTKAGKALGVETARSTAQEPTVYKVDSSVVVQDPTAPKTVEGENVAPVASADGPVAGTSVAEKPTDPAVPAGIQESVTGMQLDPAKPPQKPDSHVQAPAQQPPASEDSQGVVPSFDEQAKNEINRITTQNVPMANNLPSEARDKVVETMSAPQPVKTDLSDVHPTPETPPQPQLQESYADRTYRMVKERYPNLTISNKFTSLKVPMQIGGENGLGAGDKMNVLNYGEKVSEEWAAKTGKEREDRAVAFKLREGGQNDRLAFMIDPQNPDRIISPADTNSVNLQKLRDASLATALVFHKDGDKLIVTDAHGKDTEVSKQMLETGSYVFPLDPARGIALGLVGYGSGPDLQDDIIVLHKIEVAPTPPVPIPETARKKIVDILGPGILATAALTNLDGGDKVTVTGIPREPGPIIEIKKPIEETTSTPDQKEYKDPLQCEQFVPKTVQEGDSLTKLIVDVNGVDRYVTKGADGLFAMDVDLLYRDLMVMVAQPDNMTQLQKDDPEAASLVTAITEMKKVTGGSITSEELYDALKSKLNSPERVAGANKQLVLTHVGSEYKVPVCNPEKPAGQPQRGTPENPIPPASGSAGLAGENNQVPPQPFDTTRP